MVKESARRRQKVWLIAGGLCALCACGGNVANGPGSRADDAGLHGSTDALGADADDAGNSTTDGFGGDEGVEFSCPSPPLLPDGTSCTSWSLGSRCDYAVGDQPGSSGVCTCVAMRGTRVWSCEVVGVPVDAGLGGESTNDSGPSCEHDTCSGPAPADSGASKEANGDASFACGAQRCVSGQLCLSALSGGGPAECSPINDAGACPSDYEYVPSCPNLSSQPGCEPVPTTQADSCVSIPSGCGPTPTCGCIPQGTCPSFASQCLSVTAQWITCAGD